MLVNNLKNLKIFKSRGFIYALIFLFYLIVIIIVFIYSLKFLSKNLNKTFAPVAPQNIDERYIALDLNNYSLLAKKFGLTAPQEQKGAPTDEVETGISSTSSTSTLAILAASSSEEIIEFSSPDATNSPEIKPIQLKIAIINSTLISGLASELKKQLEAAGYPVTKIGNQKKTSTSTVLMIKTGLPRDLPALSEIKKIVSTKYYFNTDILPAESPYDLEIIIGSERINQ